MGVEAGDRPDGGGLAAFFFSHPAMIQVSVAR
jgi:hypothetical protein